MSKAEEAQDPSPSSNEGVRADDQNIQDSPSSNGNVKAEAQHTQDSSGISPNGSVKVEA